MPCSVYLPGFPPRIRVHQLDSLVTFGNVGSDCMLVSDGRCAGCDGCRNVRRPWLDLARPTCTFVVGSRAAGSVLLRDDR